MSLSSSSSSSTSEQEQYDASVEAIARKGIYEFEFVEGPKVGQKVRLERQKISNRMMRELEIERAEYGALLDKFGIGGGGNGRASSNSSSSSSVITKEDRRQAAIMLTDLYAKMAACYFKISREDFDAMDWDSTKPNIDAAANVSVRGRPNLV